MKKIILSLIMIATLSTIMISCEKDSDEFKYTCIEAQKAADAYKKTVSTNLSALELGIISMEQAFESNSRAKDKAMAIIDNAECYVSLN